MNRRSAGVSFCFISAFLYSVVFYSRAVSKWNVELISGPIIRFSRISLIIGVIYLVSVEIEGIRELKDKLLQTFGLIPKKINQWMRG